MVFWCVIIATVSNFSKSQRKVGKVVARETKVFLKEKRLPIASDLTG